MDYNTDRKKLILPEYGRNIQKMVEQLNEIEDQLTQAEFQFKSAPNKSIRDRLNQQILNLRVQLANKQLEYENALYKYNTLDDIVME